MYVDIQFTGLPKEIQDDNNGIDNGAPSHRISFTTFITLLAKSILWLVYK